MVETITAESRAEAEKITSAFLDALAKVPPGALEFAANVDKDREEGHSWNESV